MAASNDEQRHRRLVILEGPRPAHPSVRDTPQSSLAFPDLQRDAAQTAGQQTGAVQAPALGRGHEFAGIAVRHKAFQGSESAAELEADHTADAVMQAQQPTRNHATVRPLHPPSKESPGSLPPSVHQVIGSPGEPLDRSARATMEPRFGYDFSGVRVHHDPSATQSAAEVNARAYTVGQHIVFGEGQHAPESTSGQRLLAHELAHVVQPRAGALQRQAVKTDKASASTDEEVARKKGRELGELIKAGKWKPERAQELAKWLDFFEHGARTIFEMELRGILGEKWPEYEKESEGKAHPEIHAQVTQGTTVIPTSALKVVRGGFKVSYSAQIFEEDSESTSVEVYTDVSGGAEFSVEIPIQKVAKFKFSAGARKGRKETDKEEQRTARRTGRTISRNFTIQKVERDVFTMQYEKTYHGVGSEGGIARRVTYESSGYNPRETQVGYQIKPDEGGDIEGPHWNAHKGHSVVEGSALTEVWSALRKEPRKLAEDLASEER